MQTFDEIVEVRGHQPTPVTLAVRDLSYFVRAKHEENGVVMRRKAILENVSLLANPGEMVAIMSPAGAGKTTLLNVLSKRLTSRHIVGRVTYNGQNLSAEAVRVLTNYVMSSDQLYPYLTVEETLSFAAELRLPKAHGSERREVVEGLMRDLELEECRSTIIGDQWQKGCSTGQIRRVSIAVELLGNPSLLFLDEPTTGLDSSLAYDMIRILRRLTQQGRTILCALHQPSSQVMNLFDQLILASRGRVVFQGPPSTSVAYFARIGYPCPEGYNPADFFMELVSSANQDVEPLDMARELNKKGKAQLSVFSLSKEEVEVACNVFWSSPEGERLLEQIDLQMTSETDGELNVKPRHHGLWRNVSALYRRTLKNNLRSPLAVMGILVCQLIQGVFFGSLFFQLDRDVRGIDLSSSIIHKDYAQVFTYGIDFKGVRPWNRITSDGVGPHHGRPVSQVLDVLNPTKIATVASCLRSEAGLHLGEDHWVKEPVYPVAELPQRLKLTLADIASTGRHVIYQRAKTSPAVFAARFHQLERDLSTFVEAVTFIQAHHRPAIQGSIDCMDHTWRYCSNQAGRYANTVLCNQPHWEQEPMMIRTREVGEALHMLFRCALTETNQFTTPVMQCLELLPLPTLCDMSKAIPSGMWKLTNAMYGPLSSWTPGICSAPRTTTTTSTARQWVPRDRPEAKESFFTRTFHDTTSSMMCILNITAALFMGVANIAFGTYDVLLTFPKERVIFNRETANGLYHPWTFYLAKNVGDLPFQLVPNLAMAALFYWMVGLAPSASQFAMWLLIASLVSLGVYSFGYFVSAAAPRMEVAVVVAPFSLIVMAMMSGFFLRDENMPAWICWVRLFSVFRYGFNAAVINQVSFCSLMHTVLRGGLLRCAAE